MRARAIPATLVLLSLFTAPVTAAPCDTQAGQPPTGSGVIMGKVVRQDGTPFGFVDVRLEPEQASVYSDSALTEADGTFRFPSVPVGNYKLSAFADGFTPKETFGRIGVTPGSTQSFIITLMPIATETAMVVVGARTLDTLDIKKSDTSSTISGEFVTKIPLQNMRLEDIVFLYPGVARTGRSSSQPPPPRQLPNREAYGHRVDNALRNVLDEPLSTFAVDVDTASYSNVRRFLGEGTLPPPDAVRIEELVNYFRYEQARPAGDQPFGATTEITDCPWAEGHQLMRISLTTSASSAAAEAPRSLVFLIDVSGSMGEPQKLPLVQQSLRLLVERLDADDEVGIVVYAGAAGLVLPLTAASDKKTILGAIDRLSAGGSTNGAQGIQLAYELAETAQKSGAISRVILATDGDFNVGVTSEGDLVRLIEKEREKGIALTVLGFGTGNLQDDRMEALADHGNGNHAYVDCIAEAQKVLGTEMTATLVTVAKDVKIQVEFNPAVVREWRLIGYENRLLAARDFADDAKDAGEVGAGHQVTALYEIVPASASARVQPLEPLRYQQPAILTRSARADEVALLRIRWKAPTGGASRLFEKTVSSHARPLGDSSPSLRFAAAVAAFGLRLRASDGVDISWQRLRELATSAADHDEDGLRAQFLGLVDAAARLKGDG